MSGLGGFPFWVVCLKAFPEIVDTGAMVLPRPFWGGAHVWVVAMAFRRGSHFFLGVHKMAPLCKHRVYEIPIIMSWQVPFIVAFSNETGIEGLCSSTAKAVWQTIKRETGVDRWQDSHSHTHRQQNIQDL